MMTRQIAKYWPATALLFGLAACSSGFDEAPGQSIFVSTAGADGASCELQDRAGNRYFVQSTPAPVSVRLGGGPLEVRCQKLGFAMGQTTVLPGGGTADDAGLGDDILDFFGFSDDPAEAAYPGTVTVEMARAGQGPAGGPGLTGNGFGDGGFNTAQTFGAPPPPPSGGMPQSSFGAEQAPSPFTAQQAQGADLMGGSPSSTGQQTWGEVMAAGSPPPPKPSTLGPSTSGSGTLGAATTPGRPALTAGLPRVPQAPSAGAGIGDYTVQVGAFLNKANAELMLRALEARGYTPELVETTDTQGRTWARVRFGQYPSRPAALSAADAFRQRENLQAVPVLK